MTRLRAIVAILRGRPVICNAVLSEPLHVPGSAIVHNNSIVPRKQGGGDSHSWIIHGNSIV